MRKKKSSLRTCSHCYELIPEGNEFIEFKGSCFHDDRLTCIGNLKSTIERLRRTLIDINSMTNNIP